MCCEAKPRGLDDGLALGAICWLPQISEHDATPRAIQPILGHGRLAPDSRGLAREVRLRAARGERPTRRFSAENIEIKIDKPAPIAYI